MEHGSQLWGNVAFEPLRRGETVRIRDQRWRIVAERRHDDTSIVEVAGCDAANWGLATRFLRPFEPLEGLFRRSSTPQLVSRGRWTKVARATLADARPRWTSLAAAARARMAILPFQLEPALAVLRGRCCRLLIADAVGLGKTVQAGLIAAEILSRTPDARVLVVSPAGVREQWRTELRHRFDLHAEIVDAASLARSLSHMGPEANPWGAHAVVVTSIDFVKRPEVVRALEPFLWDLIIFDEAHTLCGRSDRARAAAGLAVRARIVALLTATPHSGDEHAFAKLCTIGDIQRGFPLLTFCRTRADVGLVQNRRSSWLRVRPTPAELAMHRALGAYLRLLVSHARGAECDAGANLVAALLRRRACSSAKALARSVERRRNLLAPRSADLRPQLRLPFAAVESDEEPGDELGVAALEDGETERRHLDHVLALARLAALGERKVAFLRRLLRRVRQPALVFTEYRDTLASLADDLNDFSPAILHGGLTESERRVALRRFREPSGHLLLATDAASEGLNLHHRCRLVINLEVPWTPTRLEQRIGRVDRLGQERRVHAIQLVAAGTAETATAARVAGRKARAENALGVGGPKAQEPSSLSRLALEESRRLSTGMSRPLPNDVPYAGRPVLVLIEKSHRRGCLWVVRLSVADAQGRTVFETLFGFDDGRQGVRRDSVLARATELAQAGLVEATRRDIHQWQRTLLRRERAIADALRANHARLSAGLLQGGLFDRRAERAAAAQASIFAVALGHSSKRQNAMECMAELRAGDRRIVFGVAYR